MKKRLARVMAVTGAVVMGAGLYAFADPVPAQAAVRYRTISSTNGYDLTGDGKKDRIVVKAQKQNSYLMGVRVYVNGKRALGTKDFYGTYPNEMTSQVLRFSGKKDLLFLHGEQDNDNTSNLLCQWADGKLQVISRLDQTLKPDHADNVARDYQYEADARLKKQSGDVLYIKTDIMNPTIGNFSCTVPMRYDGTALKRDSDTFRIGGALYKHVRKKALVTRSSLPAYRKPDAGQAEVYLAKGTKLKPDRVSVGDSRLWFRVKIRDKNSTSETKTVWIQGIRNMDSRPLFQFVPMAG